MVEEAPSEAHVPTQQPTSSQEARIPITHGDPSRTTRSQSTPPKGPSPSVGVIWRLRERRAFAQLRRYGRRVRKGVVTVTAVIDASSTHPPRVAFAISRKVGPAVTRNRLRRQMRAHLSELRKKDSLDSGDYLVMIAPGGAELSRDEVVTLVDHCLAELVEKRRKND